MNNEFIFFLTLPYNWGLVGPAIKTNEKNKIAQMEHAEEKCKSVPCEITGTSGNKRPLWNVHFTHGACTMHKLACFCLRSCSCVLSPLSSARGHAGLEPS